MRKSDSMGRAHEEDCPICGKSYIRRSVRQVMCKHCRKLAAIRMRENINRARYVIFERDDFRCVYCGRSSIEDGVKLCLDHIIPYSDEHKDNSVYNLATSCLECNFSKSWRWLSPNVYLRMMGRNIKLNGGITPEAKAYVERTMNALCLRQKDGVKDYGITMSQLREMLKADDPGEGIGAKEE